MRRLFCECAGTFFLVFAGCGAIIVNETGGGVIGHAGVALVFGLIVFAMINTFGDVSGAHLNPAVSVGFAVAGRFAWKEVPGYMTAQLAGAFGAGGLLKVLFPMSVTLGSTIPSGGAGRSFALEIVLTMILMLVVLSVSSGAKEKGITAGITIGSVVALEAMFAGPVSGASMNPARSLAPAVVTGQWEHLWLYPAAAFIGAFLGVLLCRVCRDPGCCEGRC